MRNMMKDYLGNDYSNNHLRNFCLYWMKGRETEPVYVNYNDIESFRKDYDEWRKRTISTVCILTETFGRIHL